MNSSADGNSETAAVTRHDWPNSNPADPENSGTGAASRRPTLQPTCSQNRDSRVRIASRSPDRLPSSADRSEKASSVLNAGAAPPSFRCRSGGSIGHGPSPDREKVFPAGWINEADSAEYVDRSGHHDLLSVMVRTLLPRSGSSPRSSKEWFADE